MKETYIQLTGTAAKKFFSRMGVSIITYIDDILVLSESFERYIRDAQFITDRLIELGLHIKWEKCLLQPNQHFYFFNFVVQTRRNFFVLRWIFIIF